MCSFLKIVKVMKKLINWISQILRDERGNPSSKRVVGVLAGLSLCVTLIMNQFTDIAIAPSDTLVNAVAALAFGALGLSSADKIWGKLQGKEEAKEKEAQPITNDCDCDCNCCKEEEL